MKRTIFGLITMVAFFAFSCQNAETNTDEENQEKTEQTEDADADAEAKAGCCEEKVTNCDGTKTVDDVLANFEEMLDEEVTVCGKATHVCAHGGQRLFLTAENSDDVMIVTTEDVFSEDLIGKKLIVTGKIVIGEVEHNHDDIAEEDHIKDEQHENALEKTFTLAANSCKTCACPGTEKEGEEKAPCDNKE
ncbi:MAG: hypothetical protein PF448_06990 [Bacteroidales bacterium]|nr:hypothetical protein [Bacteroidales bacterium]